MDDGNSSQGNAARIEYESEVTGGTETGIDGEKRSLKGRNKPITSHSKEINPILEIIRGSARPIISIIFAAVIAQVVIERIPVPEPVWAILALPIIWYFGERAVRHSRN